MERRGELKKICNANRCEETEKLKTRKEFNFKKIIVFYSGPTIYH